MERLVRGWLFVAAVTQVITGKKKKNLIRGLSTASTLKIF